MNYFKPQYWEFILDKSIDELQKKLNENFRKNFFEKLVQVNSISGHYISQSDSSFIFFPVLKNRIDSHYYGQFYPCEGNKTAVVIKNNTHYGSYIYIFLISFMSFPLGIYIYSIRQYDYISIVVLLYLTLLFFIIRFAIRLNYYIKEQFVLDFIKLLQ